MDNNYTMPSRTKALLYGDDYEEVVKQICISMENMRYLEVDYIIMVCGTAHAFLPEIYNNIPWAKDKVIDIIECLKRRLYRDNVKCIVILAAEGTLKRNIYTGYLDGINCIVPKEKDYTIIRKFIESVKQNKIDELVVDEWEKFIEKFSCDNILLGCTELPILVKHIEKTKMNVSNTINYYDPLDAVLDELKNNIM